MAKEPDAPGARPTDAVAPPFTPPWVSALSSLPRSHLPLAHLQKLEQILVCILIDMLDTDPHVRGHVALSHPAF